MSAGMMQSWLVSIHTFWFANEIVAKDCVLHWHTLD